MEKKFELGEVLISLCYVCPNKKILLKEQINMFKSLKNNYTLDDIFEYNWQSKYLYALYKNNLSKNSKSSIFNKHVLSLYNRIIQLKKKFINNETQTNYLAVTFESLSSLRVLMKPTNILNDHIMDTFIMLNKRHHNGLFYWKNKDSARIDITGHVINGILCFQG